MKRIFVAAICVIVSACATESETVYLPPPEGMPVVTPPLTSSPAESPHDITLAELQGRLGLSRSPQSLGFDEVDFDGCKYGLQEGGMSCGRRYLSVVHFRLLCRDSVETVQRAPLNFTPLVTSHMQWRLAGASGHTRTDGQGFGQVRMVSTRPTKGQRFMLIFGTKSVGVEAGEVNQIILPRDWCARVAQVEDRNDRNSAGIIAQNFGWPSAVVDQRLCDATPGAARTR